MKGHNRSHFVLKKRRRSKSIIHVRIRSSKVDNLRKLPSSSFVTVQSSKSILNDTSSRHETIKDEFGLVDDHHHHHHRKRKKFEKNKKIFFGLLLCVIFLILAVVLIPIFIVFSSPKAKISIPNPTLRWNRQGITVAGVVNTTGIANNLLNFPWGIRLDSTGRILYIADQYNNRIQKWILGSSNGSTIFGSTNGIPGSTPTTLSSPTYIIFDSNDYMYISDTQNSRIQRAQLGSTTATTIAGISNAAGNSTAQLWIPYGTVRDENTGRIYIADSQNHRIISFPSNSTAGTSGDIIIGNQGSGYNSTQLNTPLGVYLDSFTNSLIIANYGANTVVRCLLGTNFWSLIAGNLNGIGGSTATSFAGPTDVTLDPMGNIYIADRNKQRIQFLYSTESSGTTIAGVTGVYGINSTLLTYPFSLALDNQLNLFVSDRGNSRIMKYLRY